MFYELPRFKEAETAIANPMSYCQAQLTMTPDLREGYSQCLYVKGQLMSVNHMCSGVLYK